jgi:hypothetical protein
MIRVADLEPGMQFLDPITRHVWTFIAKQRHPKYPELQLVIWKNELDEWSFDALAPYMEFTQTLLKSTPQGWAQNLLDCLES